MYDRNILSLFNEWRIRKTRKPLIVRGARQVGKSVAVSIFAKKYFKDLITLNLEKDEILSMFRRTIPVSDLIQLIELKTRKKIVPGSTLLFFDEIQNSEVAMTQLRYLYEEMPHLHVIAAGSLLEVKMKREGFSFPVGRVEYCYMYPVTFDEYMKAKGEKETVEFLENTRTLSSVPDEIHHLLNKKYAEYLIVGGMPEAVAKYIEDPSFVNIDPVYESIFTGYRDDVFKYASKSRAPYIQHVIENSPYYAGKVFKYHKFGESGFRSREMKGAFDVAEKAMVLKRIYPSVSRKPPIKKNLRKSPKLIFLDMGLVNYRLGIRDEIFTSQDFNSVYHGQVSEQIVGQALKAFSNRKQFDFAFWYRDKPGSVAEIDFIIPFKSSIIPIEVKSGKAGKLKSMHLFMGESKQSLGIRVYSGKLNIQKVKASAGSVFTLVSIPFYLLYRLESILEELISDSY